MPNLVTFGQTVSKTMTIKFKIKHFSYFFTLFKVIVTLTLTFGLDMHISFERSFILLYNELGLVLLGSIHSEKSLILWKNPHFDPFSRSLWPWPSVKVTKCDIIFKPLSHTTPMLNLVTVGQIVSEKTFRFRFCLRTDGRTHGRTPEVHYIELTFALKCTWAQKLSQILQIKITLVFFPVQQKLKYC